MSCSATETGAADGGTIRDTAWTMSLPRPTFASPRSHARTSATLGSAEAETGAIVSNGSGRCGAPRGDEPAENLTLVERGLQRADKRTGVGADPS